MALIAALIALEKTIPWRRAATWLKISGPVPAAEYPRHATTTNPFRVSP